MHKEENQRMKNTQKNEEVRVCFLEQNHQAQHEDGKPGGAALAAAHDTLGMLVVRGAGDDDHSARTLGLLSGSRRGQSGVVVGCGDIAGRRSHGGAVDEGGKGAGSGRVHHRSTRDGDGGVQRDGDLNHGRGGRGDGRVLDHVGDGSQRRGGTAAAAEGGGGGRGDVLPDGDERGEDLAADRRGVGADDSGRGGGDDLGLGSGGVGGTRERGGGARRVLGADSHCGHASNRDSLSGAIGEVDRGENGLDRLGRE